MRSALGANFESFSYRLRELSSSRSFCYTPAFGVRSTWQYTGDTSWHGFASCKVVPQSGLDHRSTGRLTPPAAQALKNGFSHRRSTHRVLSRRAGTRRYSLHVATGVRRAGFSIAVFQTTRTTTLRSAPANPEGFKDLPTLNRRRGHSRTETSRRLLTTLTSEPRRVSVLSSNLFSL